MKAVQIQRGGKVTGLVDYEKMKKQTGSSSFHRRGGWLGQEQETEGDEEAMEAEYHEDNYGMES